MFKTSDMMLCAFILCIGIGTLCEGVSITDKIRDDADLSEFYSKLVKSGALNYTMQYKHATVFAPTNEAFQKLDRPAVDDETLISYHMTNVPKTIDQLGISDSSLYSETPGNTPLWITHSPGKYHDEVYVNNARLLLGQSNFKGKTYTGKEQVLHKIDEVLVPVVYYINSSTNVQYNPTAWDFIQQFETLNISPERVRLFRQRIMANNKQDIFKNEGGHTFFIPIDEGFTRNGGDSIDAKTIDGHVIPKHVLFTSPTKKEVPYPTLANGDSNLRVVLTFSEETRGKTKITYVKSHTVLSDGKHSKGVVLAQVVRANFPVKNGVIHLIHKPLMVVDQTVKQLLEQNDNGPLSKFYQAIKDAGPIGDEFLSAIGRSSDVTLFAPSNAAWDDGNLRNILRDKRQFQDILKMHLVTDKRLLLDDIARDRERNIYQAQTSNPRKKLYFNVALIDNNKTLTVEGGGVNATVIQADLAATNGVVHIINRVLGVPYATVLDKLRTDPMLNETFSLGSHHGFNYQLNDTTRKFTYFVPRDKAWYDARIQYPSAIKKLFMPEFAYHATNILERHLVISDIPYTMERIKLLTNDSRPGYNTGYNTGYTTYGTNYGNNNNYQPGYGPTNNYGSSYGNYAQKREIELPTLRDTLRLFVEERQDHTFIIHWKGEKINVFRPNVECTNGIIHVIDFPLLKESDIQVSGASAALLTRHLLIVLIIKLLTL